MCVQVWNASCKAGCCKVPVSKKNNTWSTARLYHQLLTRHFEQQGIRHTCIVGLLRPVPASVWKADHVKGVSCTVVTSFLADIWTTPSCLVSASFLIPNARLLLTVKGQAVCAFILNIGWGCHCMAGIVHSRLCFEESHVADVTREFVCLNIIYIVEHIFFVSGTHARKHTPQHTCSTFTVCVVTICVMFTRSQLSQTQRFVSPGIIVTCVVKEPLMQFKQTLHMNPRYVHGRWILVGMLWFLCLTCTHEQERIKSECALSYSKLCMLHQSTNPTLVFSCTNCRLMQKKQACSDQITNTTMHEVGVNMLRNDQEGPILGKALTALVWSFLTEQQC